MQSISLRGRPTLCNVVNAKNGEGTGPEKWRMYYFTVQTANTEPLAAGQEIISLHDLGASHTDPHPPY